MGDGASAAWPIIRPALAKHFSFRATDRKVLLPSEAKAPTPMWARAIKRHNRQAHEMRHDADISQMVALLCHFQEIHSRFLDLPNGAGSSIIGHADLSRRPDRDM